MPAWPPALGTFLSHTPCSFHGNLNLSRRAQDKKYDSSFWQFWRGQTLFPGVTLGFICPEIWLLISPLHLMYYLPNFLPKSEKIFSLLKLAKTCFVTFSQIIQANMMIWCCYLNVMVYGNESGPSVSLCMCMLITQLCPTLCNPMDYSTLGSSVLHSLSEFAQMHLHWVGDGI